MTIFLEAVLVCKQYDDFLKITLPINKKHFDNYVVVTTEEDIATQNACKENNVKFVLSENFCLNGPFNMGAATNDGFKALEKKDWILRLDADIALPDDFREQINKLELDKEYLYTASRLMRETFEQWEKYKLSEEGHKEDDIQGSGYFQMFNVFSKVLKDRHPWYSNSFPTAQGCDWDFRDLWLKKNLTKPLKFSVIHLGPAWINWSGRVTKTFDKKNEEEKKFIGKYN